MPEPDEITLTLPHDREFHRVAQLVLGGLALRLELTIETLEDLQLALETVLDRAKADGGLVTVRLTVRDGSLETSVEPVDLSGELADSDDGDDGHSLSLRRILWTVADEVQVEGDHVRLVKKVADRG
jgi:hypothetical protein